jgi:predicted Zn-dependent peptidase
MYLKEKLDNGIRVVMERVPSVKSVSVGIWVRAGSRDEEEHEQGIAHFTEHMFFKGTKRRSAQAIAHEIDAMGGELNAFTSRETTTFYVKVLEEHLPQALDLLADLLLHAQFPTREIEREKQVVFEEIKMVEDDPEDYVSELHTQKLWEKNPLGRPILGSTETVRGFRRSTIQGYLKRHYRPTETVISVAGNFSVSPVIKLLNKVFGRSESNSRPLNRRATPVTAARVTHQEKRLEQTHFCLGAHGLAVNHPDRYGLYTLNSILGGSMSSRLFQQIREKRGLAYSVYSYLSSFEDTGLLTIYAAVNSRSFREAIRLTMSVIRELKERGITKEEYRTAVSQIKGGLLLNLESTSSRMSRLAKDELYFGRQLPVKELISGIEKVKAQQVKRLAQELFDEQNLSLTVLGPVPPKTDLKAFLSV